MRKNVRTPWAFLDEFRGTSFSGEWPTIPRMFEITVSRFPDRPCFRAFEPEPLRLTYRAARDRVRAVAVHLQRSGIAAGDRVVVTGKNSPEWAVAYLGVLYAGAVVVPIDYGIPIEDARGLATFSGARAILVDGEHYDAYPPADLGMVTRVSLAKTRENYIFDLPLSGDDAASRDDASEIALPDDETSLAAILYTSGTTGNPKGVMLTHANLVSDCYLSQGNLSISETDVFYALLPLHHSYTMLAVFIESLSVGAETVFGKRLITSQILKELKLGGVTMFLGVPLLFNKLIAGINKGIREKGILVYGLMKGLMALSGGIKKLFNVNPGKKLFGSILKKVSLDTNRICISGGGPLPKSTFRQFNQLGIDFVQGYGLTETSPIVALNPTHHFKIASVGKIIERCEMRIADPDEEGNGEIQIKGPMVMQGYYNNPEATREAFTADGWLKTGDIGHIDHEGYLYLSGRAKSLIVTEGGKNVFPEEIEDKFQLYTEIEQILVRGYVKDAATRAEAVEALVYPATDFAEGKADDQVRQRIDEIISAVNHDLPMYKKISRFEVLAEPLAMTTTKKIKRHALEKE